MTDSLLEPDDRPGAQDEGERLREDVGELPPETERDLDDSSGIRGPKHLALTPPD